MHERSKFYYKKVKENGSVIIQPVLEYGHRTTKKNHLFHSSQDMHVTTAASVIKLPSLQTISHCTDMFDLQKKVDGDCETDVQNFFKLSSRRMHVYSQKLMKEHPKMVARYSFLHLRQVIFLTNYAMNAPTLGILQKKLRILSNEQPNCYYNFNLLFAIILSASIFEKYIHIITCAKYTVVCHMLVSQLNPIVIYGQTSLFFFFDS